MIEFRCENNKLMLAADCYDPCLSTEFFLVSSAMRPELAACVIANRWDLVFLILMSDCPDQVRVVWENREETLKRVFGYDHFPTHDEVKRHLNEIAV